MATVNQVGNSLTGSTGSGAFVGATSPTITTPNVGAATATSVTFSNYATGGIVGTSTNDSAASTFVGEFTSAEVLQAAAVSLTTATAKTITSISLAAGDWDVWGNVIFFPANTTVVSAGYAGTNTTTDTLPVSAYQSSITVTPTSTIVGDGSARVSATVSKRRYSLSGTTTVYLVGSATFITSTCTAFGFIYARRAR